MRQAQIPAGCTIYEALEIALIGAEVDWPRDQFVASVNDHRIPREYWSRVKPKPGTIVVFRPVARDDKFLRSALGIGVAIAALFVAPFIGGALGGFFATQTGIALIGGAITIGGSLLINALIPIRPPQIHNDARAPRNLPMIGGAQNEATPWEAVPVILGRHRIAPRYAARPFTFFSGNKQFMNFVFCVGYGRLELSDLKIGETALSSFEEVEYETRQGLPGQADLSIFPTIQNELSLSITLLQTDGFVRRTTELNSSQISIDLIAVNGCYLYDTETGEYVDRPVTINVRYRRVGETTWIDRPDIVFTRTRDTVRRGDRWAVTAGQYEVELRKETVEYDGVDQVAETIQWITLRSLTHGHPLHFPHPLALVAIRIRASNQLNGLISTFNCIAESYVTAYNGTSWVANQLSRNNADLFRHVLQGNANARPRATSQIDLDSLQDWWHDCVENDFSYNAVHWDRRTVREVLADIAAAGRATVALRNGKWGVSFPRPTDTTSWHFTPRNFSAFKTERTYREFPHALRCRFINQDRGYREDERIVYADGYSASNATTFEQVEFPGVTRSRNVWRHARFAMAQAELRPEAHTLTADIEALRLERGDRVMLTNDVLLIGTGYGRVKSVDAGAQTVEVDTRLILEIGKSYEVKFRLADGSTLTRVVFNTANETTTLELDDTLTSDMPAAGDLFSFGETALSTRNYRVLDIRPGPELTAQLVLVDDAPEIDDADTGEIPDYDPGVTDPPDPYTLTPESLTFSERFNGFGITAKSTVQVTVQIPRAGTIRAFEFQAKDIDANGDWEPFAIVPAPGLIAQRENMEPGSWQFRVRSLFMEEPNVTNDRDVSAWVESDVVSVLGVDALPPDVTSLLVEVQTQTTHLSWSNVAATNLAGYRVKYNSSTDGSATWGGSNLIRDTPINSLDVPTRAGTYMVKAYTFAEKESANEASAISTVTTGIDQNIVETITEAPHSPLFPGTHTDTQVDGLLLTLDLISGGGAYITEGFYEFDGFIDLGAVYTFRIEMRYSAAGQSIGDTMDTWVTLADVEALDTADPSSWRVQPAYKTTNDDPLSSPTSPGPFGAWTNFNSVTDVTARAARFGVYLFGSSDGRVSPAISALAVIVDMPDRHLGYKDQQSGTAAGGFTITFSPAFKSLKDVTIITHDLNTTAGERYEIVSKSESSVTIRFKDSVGTVIDRAFDLHAFGYGMVITP